MGDEAEPVGKEGRGVGDPLKGWGPTIFIVTGTLLMILGVFYGSWVMQNTGVGATLRVVPPALIASGILMAVVLAPAWWLLWLYRARVPAKSK